MKSKLLELMTKYPDYPVIPLVNATMRKPASAYGYWGGNITEVKLCKWAKYGNRIYFFEEYDALVTAMVCDVWIPERFRPHKGRRKKTRFQEITEQKKKEALKMFQDGIAVYIDFEEKPVFCGGGM